MCQGETRNAYCVVFLAAKELLCVHISAVFSKVESAWHMRDATYALCAHSPHTTQGVR